MTGGCTMNMAAEYGNDPPGALQGITQPRQAFWRFEMEPVRPDSDFKRRMVGENRNRLGRFDSDPIDQIFHLFSAKFTFAVSRTECVERKQPYRKIFNGIIDKARTGP